MALVIKIGVVVEWVWFIIYRIISPLEKQIAPPSPQLLAPVSVIMVPSWKVFVDSCRLISVCGFLICSLTFTWYSFGLLICLLGQSFANYYKKTMFYTRIPLST